MADKQFMDKVCLITGGGSGIGKATALAWAKGGGTAILLGRSVEKVESVRDEIRSSAGAAEAFAANISDASAMDDVSSAISDQFGKLDAAFFNAGDIMAGPPLHAVPQEQFDAMMDVNLQGLYQSFRITVPLIQKAGAGAIVANSAVAGLKGRPYLAPYTASKWGVIGMCLSTAAELGPEGIRVNVVAPGYIATDAWMDMLGHQADEHAARVPLKRLGDPADVADTVTWLLSDQARYITGAVIPVDGGLAIQ